MVHVVQRLTEGDRWRATSKEAHAFEALGDPTTETIVERASQMFAFKQREYPDQRRNVVFREWVWYALVRDLGHARTLPLAGGSGKRRGPTGRVGGIDVVFGEQGGRAHLGSHLRGRWRLPLRRQTRLYRICRQ